MRVASNAVIQASVDNLMRSQKALYDANFQINTELKAPDLKGYGLDAELIMAGKGAITQSETYIAAGKIAQNRMDVQDLALKELSNQATELRKALTTDDGDFIMTKMQEIFEAAQDILNTSHKGEFIFGGTRTDTKPFVANSIADLQAAATIDDTFVNNSRKPTATINKNRTIEVGELANELGRDLMGVIERVADFNASAAGPFGGEITPAQLTFIQTEIQNAIGAFDQINTLQARAGSTNKLVDNTIDAQIKQRDLLTVMVHDTEGVDPAETATRFQQAKAALDVSARTFATLSQVSLLQFI